MRYDHKAQQLRNAQAVDNPQAGDYWHEMFCAYLLVVERRGDDVLIVRPKNTEPGYWTMNMDAIQHHPVAWLKDNVRGGDVVREWGAAFVEHHLGYVPWVYMHHDELPMEDME
jgi:hypothetical protein